MKRHITIAALVVASFALTGCVANDPLANEVVEQNYTSADGTITELAIANRDAPISFESTATTDGSTVSSEDYLGSVLVVNFWFASCPPCRYEAPDLADIAANYAAEGVQFLGVNVYDELDMAKSFETDFAIPYPSVLDVATGEIRLAFSGQLPPNGVPTTVIVDRSGRVAARLSGAIMDRAVFEDMIDSVLAEPAE